MREMTTGRRCEAHRRLLLLIPDTAIAARPPLPLLLMRFAPIIYNLGTVPKQVLIVAYVVVESVDVCSRQILYTTYNIRGHAAADMSSFSFVCLSVCLERRALKMPHFRPHRHE